MTTDKPLTFSERRIFTKLLNEGGYVLNFTNHDFGEFTAEITGINLLDKYQESKGKSLSAFLTEAPRSSSIPLLCALMEEWERTRRDGANESTLQLAEACNLRLKELNDSITDDAVGTLLKSRGFTSDYLDEQRKLLWEKASSHPTASIGVAKELVESCCKTILEHHKVEHSKADDLPKLVDKTQSALSINPREVDRNVADERAVKALLGSLAGVARSLGELRNSYGIGHGKAASYKGLSERHARLAAGSALTLVDYLWATHLKKTTPHGAIEG